MHKALPSFFDLCFLAETAEHSKTLTIITDKRTAEDAIVISAVRAPSRSNRAFVATVVPIRILGCALWKPVFVKQLVFL